ncbi:DcaP family trimeric outer membrane transporter [Reichenbachiella ulvae]|uniref:DcaP family trimeric outer membrane transporter n=1 Tax=Reichenbachiella ulvae TaxID=2980104 RepID=A0ABT3CRM0_9BACT|nr:DcaP family trimeric outer membrane transporter [Reichenbachiella ulvae]MCV9386279.1 DcaP family trimeric outer membrane transporter [Reichenbachiella ulvae]
MIKARIKLIFIICLFTGTFISPQLLLAQNQYSVLRGSAEDSLTTKDFPGAWNLPGTNLYMKFGGYFRLDAIYDFSGAGSRNQLLINQVPVEGTAEAANASPFFNMHVRETRFNFDLRRTTDMGRPLKFFLEFDFFDESLSAGQPRLRHAFVKYGNLLIGQTWTNLSDLRVFPFIMDFSSGDALFGGRSIQIRWEQNFAKNMQYAVSIENPTVNGIANPFNLNGNSMPTMPLLSARLTNDRPRGMLMFGGQVQQLRWNQGSSGSPFTGVGWGVIFNGRQSITDKLFATWHTSYNSGMTNQILIFGGTDQGAVLLSNGDIQNEDAITLALGAGYQLTKKLSTNLAYAHMNRGELTYRPDDTIDNGGMGHFNFMYQLDTFAMTGIEFAWSHVENKDRAKGEAYRIQAMIRYSF